MLQTILRKIAAYCGAGGVKRAWIPVLCGFAYSLGSPPFSSLLHPIFALMPLLSNVSLIPLFYFATRLPRRRAFAYSYLFCAAMILGQKYWIGFVAYDGLWIYILIGVALISIVWGALYFAAALAFRLCARKIPRLYVVVYPAVWVLFDYSRTLTDLAFPWSYIGYGAVGILPIAQFASFTGVWGLTYLIVLGNIVIWELLRACYNAGDKENLRRKWLSFGAWAALSMGIFVWGAFRMNMKPPASETTRVALMQSYMDQFNWGLGSLDTAVTVSDSMLRVVEKDGPELIIFPESALLCYLLSPRRRDVKEHVLAWADRTNVPILLGSLHYEDQKNAPGAPIRSDDDSRAYYNTAFLVENGKLTPYNKIMLVPFSERMPFEIRIPILSRVRLRSGFSRGKDEAVFRINRNLEIAPYICYEIIFPDFVRRRLKESTNLLVNITNDGWFGRSSGPYQHAAMSQLRSIENGITLARAANSGISMFVDPHGRTLAKTGLYTREIAVADIPAYRITTFYARFGDWFVAFCAILTAVGIVVGVIQKRRVGEITNPILIDEKRNLTPASACQSECV